jgi:transposase
MTMVKTRAITGGVDAHADVHVAAALDPVGGLLGVAEFCRAEFLDDQLARLDELIVPLVAARAPALLRLHGIGPDTAARLLISAGDHPGRLRSEAAWAHLCGVAPIPASSGKTTRCRHGPGGDRQTGHALWRIVITRMSSHPPTRAYVQRRTKEGLSKTEIIRCLKRYVARQVYPYLRAPF